MILGKKAVGWEYILGAASVALVLIFIVPLFLGSQAQARDVLDISFSQKNDLCKAAGQHQDALRGSVMELAENPKDNYPDNCDICIGGDNDLVSNPYGIPDGCYQETNKAGATYKDICLSFPGTCFVKQTNQCCHSGQECDKLQHPCIR